jgi:acyl carrier protein
MAIEVRGTILETFQEVAQQNGVKLLDEIPDSAELFEIGLDSIGFATVVASLEVKLGYDPFIEMAEPVYPTTLSEFVGIYEEFSHLAVPQ